MLRCGLKHKVAVTATLSIRLTSKLSGRATEQPNRLDRELKLSNDD